LAKYYVENENRGKTGKLSFRLAGKQKNPLTGVQGNQITAINAIMDELIVLFVDNKVI
jgi:hypothetical protein